MNLLVKLMAFDILSKQRWKTYLRLFLAEEKHLKTLALLSCFVVHCVKISTPLIERGAKRSGVLMNSQESGDELDWS